VSRPLVAIVGAPNIGKSTLFNRLVGWRKAIVTDEPGVTRDRNYGDVRDVPRPFRLVDTGGLTPNTAAPFAREIEAQADAAMDEAACILFVVDARSGATAVDRDVAEHLRRRSVPVLLVANKVDSDKQESAVWELHELGLGDPIPVSAEHGRGVDRLLDAIEEVLGPQGPGDAERLAEDDEAGDDEEEGPVRIALVGRPNVGKSSILNRLFGADRVVVSDVAGTTRDSVDTLLERDGRTYLLVDTAGIRRRGKTRLAAEATSVMMARRSMERCHVAVLVLDATQPFAAQDAHIAGYARDAWRPLVVAVNKWDLVDGREEAAKAWLETVRDRLRFVHEAPMLLVSAKSGQRVTRILDEADACHRAASIRVPTPALNRWLQDVARAERSAPARGRSIRLFYAAQTGVRPPRFALFCNDPAHVHFSLERHLVNGLRERFGFGPAPIRLDFRRRTRRGET
jgi:GTP-binding protein